MNDLIKDLDAAVTGAQPSFAEEHPGAPEWAVELADGIEANAARLKRQKRAKKRKEQAVRQHLERAVNETTERVATLATQAGVATEEEKRLAKEATGVDDVAELSDLGAVFDPRQNQEIPE